MLLTNLLLDAHCNPNSMNIVSFHYSLMPIPGHPQHIHAKYVILLFCVWVLLVAHEFSSLSEGLWVALSSVTWWGTHIQMIFSVMGCACVLPHDLFLLLPNFCSFSLQSLLGYFPVAEALCAFCSLTICLSLWVWIALIFHSAHCLRPLHLVSQSPCFLH